MESTPAEIEKREHLRKIINAAQTGMFITYTPHGLHGRPMANAQVADPLTSIWFATSRSSAKIDELAKDNRLFLSYHGSGTEWAAINGRALVVNDRAKITQLWSVFWKNWFNSPDDPDLVLLEVIPTSAEYWDSGNKLIAYVKFAVATLAGTKLSSNDHQTVRV